MPVTIVNPNPKFPKGKYIDPSPLGYIHIAGDVEGRDKPGPVLRKSKEKKALLKQLKELGQRLQQVEAVERVSVFQAVVFMPPGNYVKAHPETKMAKYDVVVLVQTTLPESIPEVQASDEYKAVVAALEQKAKTINIMPARNIKRVGAVDRTRQGLFAFNYFVADDAQTAKDLWDYFAGWYQVKAGLTSSELLAPLEGQESAYVMINSARWKYTMPARFLSKPSFWKYVVPNLDANQVGLMPVAYRLA